MSRKRLVQGCISAFLATTISVAFAQTGGGGMLIAKYKMIGSDFFGKEISGEISSLSCGGNGKDIALASSTITENHILTKDFGRILLTGNVTGFNLTLDPEFSSKLDEYCRK